jgi:hypothetical protein
MKSYRILVVATTLALLIVVAFPYRARACPHGLPMPADGMSTKGLCPGVTDRDEVVTSGDYAVHVHASGAYSDDGVIVPVFEALEARYAAANREFTVEYWFKLPSGYDSNNKELFDHHIPSNEGFWTAFQNGHLWAGIDTEPGNDSTAIHLHTGSGFNDGEWHHYALVRDLSGAPNRLCLYLDGVGNCYVDGSVSQWAHVYEDIRPSNNRDGDSDNNYPFYVIGARTSGAGEIEATIDELRISDTARYRSDFTPSSVPFVLDANTVMQFHFDEGTGNVTYGRDSNNNPVEGTLVQDLGWYGIGATPLDPGDPADAAWLAQMWVDGRFGATVSPLTLTTPNGGLWLTGSPYPITWTSTGTTAHVSLSYSTDGFTTVNETIVDSTPNTGVYMWTTPVTPSKTIRVRVADADDPAIYDDSDANFVVVDVIYFAYLPFIHKQWH